MTVRRDSARKRVPREAYLVSRMRRYRHNLSVLCFTLHERRFTCKRSESAIGAEELMNHGRYEEQRLTVFGGYVTVALV